jgi:hypothetical protein
MDAVWSVNTELATIAMTLLTLGCESIARFIGAVEVLGVCWQCTLAPCADFLTVWCVHDFIVVVDAE